MDIHQYVEQEFGAEAIKKLQNIRVGGDNNRKGATFEDFFAVAQMIELAASTPDLDDFVFSAQELAFVDDLCIRQISSRTKTNYQAKNSSNQSADWTPDIEQRFTWQLQVDRNVHYFPASFQVLLVSSPDKAASNQRKIPVANRSSFSSEYFPYHTAPPELILSHTRLRDSLEVLCQSRDLSLADSAFRIVLGIWCSEQATITLQDVFSRAREISRPDLFSGLLRTPLMLPAWLTAKCGQFPNVTARVERGRFIVSYKGLDVALPAGTDTPASSLLESLHSLEDFLNFLMTSAIAEIKP